MRKYMCTCTPIPPLQVLSVVLLAGTLHYCEEKGNDEGFDERLDPYYLVPAGESINKTWCACHGRLPTACDPPAV